MRMKDGKNAHIVIKCKIEKGFLINIVELAEIIKNSLIAIWSLFYKICWIGKLYSQKYG